MRCVFAVLCTCLIAFPSCQHPRQSSLQQKPGAEDQIPVEGYSLVWSDEFEGQALDREKWGYRALGKRRDAVNVKDTVSLDGQGHLVLTTWRRNDRYETAMIGTQDKFETAFGYFEARVKVQEELGHWSAFWLQSPTMGDSIGDPARAGTEIDVMEYLRKRGDVVQHTLHWDGYGEHHQSAGKKVEVENFGQGWHTVGLLWTPDSYTFYVDGEKTWHTEKGISHRPEYMILSLEVGEWAGNIAKANLPDRFYVDYVRVYKADKKD